MNGIANENETENDSNNKPMEVISKRIISFVKTEQNAYLNEILTSLINYKTKAYFYNNTQNIIQSEPFKISFYSALENFLYQISDIKSEVIRQKKIPAMYRWYKEKADTHNQLSSMSIKSTMGLDQDYTEEISNAERVIQQDEPMNHRSKDAMAIRVSEQLKHYKVKKYSDFSGNDFNKSNKDPDPDIEGEGKGEEKELVTNLNEEKKEQVHNQMASTFKSQTKSVYYSSDILNKTRAFTKTTFLTNSLSNHNFTTREILPSKEVKSSYSYSRPPYEYSLLNLEREIMKAKNKELADKRSQESIRLRLRDYGINRALYKKQMIKKRELKDLVTFYKATTPEDNMNKSNNNDFNANINQIFSLQKSHRLSKKQTLNNIRYSIAQQIIPEEHYKENKISKRESPKRLIERSKSQYITPIAKSVLKMNKVDTNDVQNLNQFKAITHPVISEIKVLLKAKQMKAMSIKAINSDSKRESGEIPSDTIYSSIHYNKILKTRLSNKALCGINELDSPKKVHCIDSTPLSAFDLTSCKSFDKNNSTPSLLYQSHSGYDFVKKNFIFHSNDFLNFKKTIDNFKINEISELKKKIGFELNDVNKKALNRAFSNPNMDVHYPVCYLPHSGSGLLNISPAAVVKKK